MYFPFPFLELEGMLRMVDVNSFSYWEIKYLNPEEKWNKVSEQQVAFTAFYCALCYTHLKT